MGLKLSFLEAVLLFFTQPGVLILRGTHTPGCGTTRTKTTKPSPQRQLQARDCPEIVPLFSVTNMQKQHMQGRIRGRILERADGLFR